MPEWVSAVVTAAYALAAPLALLVAALAWLVKLRWSREFVAAKNAEIAAKDAQIASLREEMRARLDAEEEALKAKDAQAEALRTQVETLREQAAPRMLEWFTSTKKGYEVVIVGLSPLCRFPRPTSRKSTTRRFDTL